MKLNKQKKHYSVLADPAQSSTRRQNLIKRLQSLRPKKVLSSHGFIFYGTLAFIAAPLAPTLAVATSFVQPNEVELSLSRTTCFSKTVLFPGSNTYEHNENLSIYSSGGASIGQYRLYGREVCIEPTGNVEAEPIVVESQMLGILKSEVKIMPQLPDVVSTDNTPLLLSPTDKLDLQLDQADAFSDYSLKHKNNRAPCDKNETNLSCDLNQLKLGYSKNYQIQLVSSINNSPERDVYQIAVKTSDPLLLEESTLKNDVKIYNKTATYELTFNRQLDLTGEATLVSEQAVEQPILRTDNKTLIVELPADMPRSTDFTLRIAGVKATDGSTLEKPLEYKLRTSGGPKVTSTNLSATGVSRTQNISVTFDYELDGNQSITDLIKLTSQNTVLATTAYVSGNQMVINPSATLPKCASITLNIKAGVSNKHGITTGDNAYSKVFRTQCADIISIGSSVEGRSINAYGYGTGDRVALFYGGLHGNEKSSKYILDSFASDLEANPSLIPANTTIWIVPNVNPDGFAKNTRNNANNIDLNRNFDTHDWTPDVGTPYGTAIGGGGKKPFSEPESQAIANFTKSSGADVVVYYHAVANTVIANGTSKSYNLAKTYSDISGYIDRSYASNSDVFSYEATGTYGDWSRDSAGIPGVLIELRTMGSNEYSLNKNAIMRMLKDF